MVSCGQTAATDEKTARRIPLLNEEGKPITTLGAAKESVEILRGRRRENSLMSAGRKPLFDEFANSYLEMAQTALKQNATRAKETRALRMWDCISALLEWIELPVPRSPRSSRKG
jgi:hypothetical protein